MYRIEDWAGNIMFGGKLFSHFEDAWDYIYENVDSTEYDRTNNENDNPYQDYFVIKIKP